MLIILLVRRYLITVSLIVFCTIVTLSILYNIIPSFYVKQVNEQQFSAMIREIVEGGESIDNYLDRMSQDGTWGMMPQWYTSGRFMCIQMSQKTVKYNLFADLDLLFKTTSG